MTSPKQELKKQALRNSAHLFFWLAQTFERNKDIIFSSNWIGLYPYNFLLYNGIFQERVLEALQNLREPWYCTHSRVITPNSRFPTCYRHHHHHHHHYPKWASCLRFTWNKLLLCCTVNIPRKKIVPIMRKFFPCWFTVYLVRLRRIHTFFLSRWYHPIILKLFYSIQADFILFGE